MSATTAGAKYYYNTLRKGSEHEVHAVYDRMTGEELKWEIVEGVDALMYGHPLADPNTQYLKVFLGQS